VGIFDNFKDLFKAAEVVNNADLYKKLGETQNAVFALEEENRNLKDELREIKAQKEIDDELQPDDNAYWRIKGGKRDGPFCMRCWDVDRKLVRERAGATAGTHYCSDCHMRAAARR
jgi:hypothetical protein